MFLVLFSWYNLISDNIQYSISPNKPPTREYCSLEKFVRTPPSCWWRSARRARWRVCFLEGGALKQQSLVIYSHFFDTCRKKEHGRTVEGDHSQGEEGGALQEYWDGNGVQSFGDSLLKGLNKNPNWTNNQQENQPALYNRSLGRTDTLWDSGNPPGRKNHENV